MQFDYIYFSAFFELTILLTTKAEIPGCQFWKTVNISSSQLLRNGSYLFQGLVVPVELIGEYNYKNTELGNFKETDSHMRGCVCHLKPCLWICCRFKDWDASNEKCTDGLMEELSEINPSLKATLSNGSVVKRNLLMDFIVLRDRMGIFDTWKEDSYTLFENGSVILNSHINGIIKSKGYDCIHPNQFSSGNTDIFAFARHKWFYYEISIPPGGSELIWLSEVFLIFTIAVYLYVKKLRTLHGKCFICYMITSFIFFMNYFGPTMIAFQFCALLAYNYYFILMAKFTWLLSLSHQMWNGFTSINRAESQLSFRAYSIFAWGTAALMTGILFLIDYIWADNPSMANWIPGAGWQKCDINKHVTYIYIDGPVNTFIALNTVFFIWTTITIIRVKLSLKNFSDSGDTARNLNSRMQAYTMYIRLFIVMDIQWSVRFISVLRDWRYLYMICVYCEFCMGILIFVLFILKRSTILLIIESIRNGNQ